jgi:hypothetical protein
MPEKKVLSALFATVIASLCCITPVLAVLAGASSFASSFAWLEPYHNYLVGLTIAVLIYAWWDKLRPKTEQQECACDEKASFFSSKKFLAIVSVLAITMMTFPQWGYQYFETEKACTSCVIEAE